MPDKPTLYELAWQKFYLADFTQDQRDKMPDSTYTQLRDKYIRGWHDCFQCIVFTIAALPTEDAQDNSMALVEQELTEYREARMNGKYM